jgi:hypothetical protein
VGGAPKWYAEQQQPTSYALIETALAAGQIDQGPH